MNYKLAWLWPIGGTVACEDACPSIAILDLGWCICGRHHIVRDVHMESPISWRCLLPALMSARAGSTSGHDFLLQGCRHDHICDGVHGDASLTKRDAANKTLSKPRRSERVDANQRNACMDPHLGLVKSDYTVLRCLVAALWVCFMKCIVISCCVTTVLVHPWGKRVVRCRLVYA